MTPEKYIELTKQLAGQGLSVLPTRDFDAILMQLARLVQFERLMITALENDPLELLDVIMEEVHAEQNAAADIPGCAAMRPLEILDIPSIQIETFRALYDRLDKNICINPTRVHAAVSAFVGILCAEG
ncbi:MAG: hypothetical protein PHC49_10705 [Desulfuromonadaceae bacterium]|nr:hypothetical protein [Desulfuromonadaceae bacterium]